MGVGVGGSDKAHDEWPWFHHQRRGHDHLPRVGEFRGQGWWGRRGKRRMVKISNNSRTGEDDKQVKI